MHPGAIQNGTFDAPYANRLMGACNQTVEREPSRLQTGFLNDRYVRVSTGADDLEKEFSKLTLAERLPSHFIPVTDTQAQLKKYTDITEQTDKREQIDHVCQRIAAAVKDAPGVLAYELNNFSEQFYAHNISGNSDGFYAALGPKIYYLKITARKATCVYNANLKVYDIRTLHAFDGMNPKIIFGLQNFRSMSVLDASTRTILHTLPWRWNSGRLQAVTSIGFSTLFLAHAHGDVQQYDCRDNTLELFHQDRYQMPICSLQLSPDQRKLAGGRDDGSILIWDLRKSREPLSTHESGFDTPFRALAWTPDSSGHLYAGDGQVTHRLRLFDTNIINSSDIVSWRLGSCISDITFINRNIFLASQQDPTEVLYRKEDDVLRVATLRPAPRCRAISRTLGTYFSKESGVLAAVSANQTVTLYDLNQLRRIEERKPAAAPTRSITFSIR